jgi:curved DNA-binding protein CbpA
MDHYAILGVSPDAGNVELNNAFKRKSNLLTPASNNNITRRHYALRNASKAKQALKESYNLLKNKQRRNEYNRTRRVIEEPSDYKIISQLIQPKLHFTMRSHWDDLSPQQELDGIGKDLQTFSSAISEELKKGYSLVGIPFYSSSPNYIYQALIKDNKELSEMIILPVIANDKIDARIFPVINENVLKKGFRPYESPIRMRSTHHMGANTIFHFQVFIK